MESTKYIGMDVHKEATTIAVLDPSGRLVMESIVETKAATIVQLVQGLRGDLHVTFEEGTWAAWLYDLLKPYVTKVVVCDPRKNALLQSGNKSDRIDARKLAELFRAGLVSGVYHGQISLRTLRELARSYLTISKDLTRTMNRLKALYRSWSIPCAGTSVYDARKHPRRSASGETYLLTSPFIGLPCCRQCSPKLSGFSAYVLYFQSLRKFSSWTSVGLH